MIELLHEPDLDALCDHLIRNALESGRDGDPLARARSADDVPDRHGLRFRFGTAWARPTSQPGWERCWGLRVDGALRGHLDLRGGTFASEMHRANLGIGVERPWRGAGWGRRLMQAAIDWSRAQGLVWLDLGVFAENGPAIALYQRLGFVTVGRVDDRYRVDGRSVDDISMVLRLAPAATMIP